MNNISSFLKDFFKLRGSLSAAKYGFAMFIIIPLVSYGISYLFYDKNILGWSAENLNSYYSLILFCTVVLILFVLTIRRLGTLNLPTYLFLLVFIPIINILLVLYLVLYDYIHKAKLNQN